nr:DUF1016 N-terminal domain-containing protein [uncultured Dyadobacter sp.]
MRYQKVVVTSNVLDVANKIMNPEIYQSQFITEIKEKVRSAQYEALKTVNVRLIQLYWEIGKSIAEKQNESWGKSIVISLSKRAASRVPEIERIFSHQYLVYGSILH